MKGGLVPLGKKKFYDTCSLLAEINNDDLFAERFYISSTGKLNGRHKYYLCESRKNLSLLKRLEK